MIFPNEITHLPNNLDEAATNCYEAAMLRNIEPGRELKTLLLKWHDEIHEFNLPGDRTIDSLDPDYHWVPADLLRKHGLMRGAINPFSVQARLPLVSYIAFCSSVFDFDFVYTNDGTLNGTIIIPTNKLLEYFPSADVFLFSSPA